MKLTDLESFLASVHPDDRPDVFVQWSSMLKDKIARTGEVRLFEASGNYNWYRQNVIIMDEVFVVLFTDVNEYKKTDHRRMKLLAGLSHDLRTPLTAAKLKAQMASRVSEDERLKDLSTQIVRDMDRAENLIRNILDSGKREAGMSTGLRFEKFDLSKRVETFVNDLRSLYPFDVIWDPESLGRMLGNLLSNAMKYGDRGRAIEIRIKKVETEIHLSVRNFGISIPPESLTSLFLEYERGGAHHTTSGWGLGLMVVKDLCEDHGGRVLVSSSEEEGTVFTLALPQDARPLRSPVPVPEE